jgi:hypothetical protein
MALSSSAKIFTLSMIIVATGTLLCISLPDPTDPSNTKITPFILSIDTVVYKEDLWDTAGKPFTVGAALYLPQNFNSVRLVINDGNKTVCDTTFIDFADKMFYDTLWKAITISEPGTYLAIFTPDARPALQPESIQIVMLASPVTKQNHPPTIDISGNTSLKSGETCVLVINTNDSDSGQILTSTVHGGPDGATFLNNTFFWAVPKNFIGSDTIVFTLTDNGDPAQSVTKQVILTVASDTKNRAPAWNADTLRKSLNDTSTLSLQLSGMCNDPDGDTLKYLLLQRSPNTDSIVNGVYNFRASPLSVGTHYIGIVAADPGGTSDTVILQMKVQLLPSTSVQLAKISFSTGTLKEKLAPVPDTLYDTVSFVDSSVTISFIPWNSLAVVSVNGTVIPSGTTEKSFSLTTGVNTFSLTLKTADTSLNKTFTLYIVRKTNSIEPLTTPPGGLKIDSVSATWIRIKWDDLPKATSYSVERSKQNTESYVAVGTVGSNSLTDTGLEAGTTYYYKVKASNSAGSTDFCTAISGATIIKPALQKQPRDTTVTFAMPLKLNCSAAGSVVLYQWRKNGIDLPGKNGASLEFTSVTMGDTGVYTIKVWNNADSVVSTPFKVGVLPVQPTGVVATARSATSAEITWNATDGATSFLVLRSGSNGAVTSVGTTVTSSIIDSSLTEGTLYRYRIIAVNSFGKSDTSMVAEVTTWSGPAITTDLGATLTIAEGQPLKLSVAATGIPACTYQWKKNDIEIAGATSNEYMVSPAYTVNSGTYSVVIKNSVRTVSSKQIKVDILPLYTLNTSVLPSTGGTITKEKDTTSYLSGSTVKLTATPKPGYRFDGWGGDVSDIGNVVNVTMSKNMSVSAKFVKQYTLTVISAAPAKGTVAPATAALVDSGKDYTITATPNSGFKFKTWSTTSSGVVFGSATATSTSARLSSSDATVKGEFGCITFKKQLSFSQYPELTSFDLIQTSDAGFMLIEQTSTDGLLVKLNTYGDTVWTKFLTGYKAKSIQKANTGYNVTGGTETGSSYNMHVANYSEDGNKSWTFVYGINLDKFYSGKITKLTKDNKYVILGTEGINLQIVKIEEYGQKVWETLIDDGDAYYPEDFIELNDGYLFVGAIAQGFGHFILKTDKNGNLQWKMNLNKYFQDGVPGGVTSICVASDGDCVISGNASKNGETSPYLAKMSPNDTNQIQFFYLNGISINSVKTIADGYIIAGEENYNEGDIYIAKVSKTGVILWKSVFSTNEAKWGPQIKLTSDGGYIMMGTNNWIIKTDENGKIE